MIKHFKRGRYVRNGRSHYVVYIATAHDYIIHRGQRFFIEYEGERINVTHGVSGYAIEERNFGFKVHDSKEEIERKIRRCLDDNWSDLLRRVKNLSINNAPKFKWC